MKFHTFFIFRKLGKMSQKVLPAAVVIVALRVKISTTHRTKSKKEGKRQESLQSSTTPDPG